MPKKKHGSRRELEDERFCFLRELIEEHDKRYQERFDAQEKAVLKAEGANEKRFESVNEFRAQLSDEQSTFLTRSEYETKHSALIEKIEHAADKSLSTILSVAAILVSTGSAITYLILSHH